MPPQDKELDDLIRDENITEPRWPKLPHDDLVKVMREFAHDPHTWTTERILARMNECSEAPYTFEEISDAVLDATRPGRRR